MQKEIGDAAGMIWRFLEKQSEPVNLTILKKNVPVSSTLLMMGLGWLAREDKIKLEIPEDSYSYRIYVNS